MTFLRAVAPTSALALVLISVVVASTASCQRRDAPLGPPDSYVVYELGQGGEADPPAAALPVAKEVPLDDARARPIHRAAEEGFVGELLRTDYLAKQLIRDGWRGKAFGAAARQAAAEPTVLVIGGSRMMSPGEARLGNGVAVRGFFGTPAPHPQLLWIEAGDDPPSDPAFVQTASGRVARLIAERLVVAADPAGLASTAAAQALQAARPLIDGYALAMEVIGREWRVGEGPQGTLAPNAGTGTQRERFAGVRGNGFVFASGDHATLRPGAEMLADPGVVAAVLYRMAQASGVGRRVAPAEIYAPFVADRVPPGISPAAVLGQVRNFQVKLLSAWGAAILTGRPPHDLVDLVTAYAEALPAERADLFRIFVVTTYGATLKAGGVSPKPADADKTLAELTTLAAEAAAGRRSLRAALTPTP